MDRFSAECFYKTEHIPVWKTILFLFLAIGFSIGTFALYFSFPSPNFSPFFTVIFLSFILSFIYWFFRGWSSSKVCKYEIDPKYKGYSLAVVKKGLPISVIDLKNILAVQNQGELNDEAKRNISLFYKLLNKISSKSIDLYTLEKEVELNTEKFFLFLYKLVVCFVGPALIILFFPVQELASWIQVILTILCFFAGEFFWYMFGLYRTGEKIIPDPKFEDLSNLINAEKVIQNYLISYENYYESYYSLDFSDICRVFNFQENDIDYLCARLIEIDLLEKKEEMRSFYKAFSRQTNFLTIGRTYLYFILFFLFVA